MGRFGKALLFWDLCLTCRKPLAWTLIVFHFNNPTELNGNYLLKFPATYLLSTGLKV